MKTKRDIVSRRDKGKTNLRLRVGLFLALHILFTFSNTLNSLDRIVKEHSFAINQIAPVTRKQIFGGMKEFNNAAFARIINIHDQYLSEFTRWRGLVSGHADELARLVKTFPGSEQLKKKALRQVFSNLYLTGDGFASKDVFEPWTNQWSGTWSNGKMQYHIWDSTKQLYGRMIQRVTLSESRFVKIDRAQEMARTGKADMAVNIFSPAAGITGWVSKYQSGRWELPHIGYSINDTALIWIAQIKSPDNLFAPDSLWFIFLEIVQTNSKPREYHIYGLPVTITDRLVVQNDQRGKHQGIYYAAAGLILASQQKIEGGRDGI